VPVCGGDRSFGSARANGGCWGEREHCNICCRALKDAWNLRALTPPPPQQPHSTGVPPAAVGGPTSPNAGHTRATSAARCRSARAALHTSRAHVCSYACTYTSGRYIRVTSTIRRAPLVADVHAGLPRGRGAEPREVCALAPRSWPPAQAVGRPAPRGAPVVGGAAHRQRRRWPR